jgi:hypothetical protein
MSRSSSLNPSNRDREQQIKQILSKGLEKASCSTLSDEETAQMKEMIHKTPETTLEILEPSVLSFAGTIEFNAALFRDTILPLLLSSPLREEYVPLKLRLIQNLLDFDIFTSNSSGLRDIVFAFSGGTYVAAGPVFTEL